MSPKPAIVYGAEDVRPCWMKEAVMILILLEGSWGGCLLRYQAEKRTESSLAAVPEPETLTKQQPRACLHSEDEMLLTMQQATRAP